MSHGVVPGVLAGSHGQPQHQAASLATKMNPIEQLDFQSDQFAHNNRQRQLTADEIARQQQQLTNQQVDEFRHKNLVRSSLDFSAFFGCRYFQKLTFSFCLGEETFSERFGEEFGRRECAEKRRADR